MSYAPLRRSPECHNSLMVFLSSYRAHFLADEMRLKEPAVDEEFWRIYLYFLRADYNSVIIYKLKVFL